MSRKQWMHGFFTGKKKGLNKGRKQGIMIGAAFTAAVAFILDVSRKK